MSTKQTSSRYSARYHDLIEFINKGRKCNERKIANNTIVVHFPDEKLCRIYLHGNCIAVIEPDSIFLMTAGWYTVTTKDRLNAIIGDWPFRIQQYDYVWYLCEWIDNTWQIVCEFGKQISISYDGSSFRVRENGSM